MLKKDLKIKNNGTLEQFWNRKFSIISLVYSILFYVLYFLSKRIKIILTRPIQKIVYPTWLIKPFNEKSMEHWNIGTKQAKSLISQALKCSIILKKIPNFGTNAEHLDP